LLDEWELYHHACALAFAGRFGGDGSALGSDQRFADGESQPHFAGIAAAGFVGAVEAVEQVGQILRFDAGAAVGNAQPDFFGGGQLDGSALGV